jgi:hypothetical protein
MPRITIPNNVRAQLGGLSEPLVFCDESGNPLGTFAPIKDLTEHQRIAMGLPDDQLDSATPVEELRRRLHEEGRVDHEEVVRKAKQHL